MTSDKLYKLRKGTPPHKRVTVRGEDFVVVLLSSDTVRAIEEETNDYVNNGANRNSDSVRNKTFDGLLAYYCLRDPDDLSKLVAEKPSEIMEILDDIDIATITGAYGELIMNKAPKVEMIGQEELDTIKKHLEVTQMKDLSTVLCVHLANCHRTIASEE